MTAKQNPPDLSLAFDVGHSSIGWAVLQDKPELEIKGCGAVIFRADDCLASARRQYRRQRRHIRSTRQRIARMKILIAHLGALTKDQLDKPGCAWPWKLAARALVGGKTLTWPELWDVLRWYAHNRGYDGNRRWSNEQTDEDSEKEKIAIGVLAEFEKKHGRKGTMAEAFCDRLEVLTNEKCASRRRFKDLGAAFPREGVEEEVRRILKAHVGKLPKVDAQLERVLVGVDWNDKDAWKAIPWFEKPLPQRYQGGLLFGQLVPRFDNRIIGKCPVTYAKTYQTRFAAGESHDVASRKATIASKLPLKRSREFLEYRWSMLLANLLVTDTLSGARRKLTANERTLVDDAMHHKGFFTAKEFEEVVADATGCRETNIDATFKIAPDAEEALVLDPVSKLLASNSLVQLVWPILPERLQKRLRGRLRKGKRIRLNEIRDLLDKSEQFDEALKRQIAAETLQLVKKATRRKTLSKKERNPPTFDEMLKRNLAADFPSGRAPYHRRILVQVRNEVLAGFDPRKKKQDKTAQSIEQYESAENKSNDGCLVLTEAMQRINLGQAISDEAGSAGYEVWRKRWLTRPKNRARYDAAGDSRESLVQQEYERAEANRWLASCSNNHLVRHRLLILGRRVDDIRREYAGGQKERIGKIVIEVTRDLVAFSGMKKADIGSDTKGVLGSIKAQHYRVKKWLEEGLKETKWRDTVNGRLIWKAKVADDLGLKCPYTGESITPYGLANGDFDVDHIIPRSQRLTNAMEAVVVTHRQVNAMKKDRTARQFITECGGQKVPGTNWELRRFDGPIGYEQFVHDLKTHGTGKSKEDEHGGGDKKGIKLNPMYLPGTKKKHPDYIRRKKRKGYLMVKEFEKDKERFTPRDLTITSFVNRLAQHVLLRELPHLGPEHVVSIPGSVTGAVRDAKGWRLLGCLQAACGEKVTREITIRDALTGEPKQVRVVKPKGDLRKITHLHHAVDACTLGLLAGLIPKNGKLWELIALKEVTEAEKTQFEQLMKEYRYRGHPVADYFAVSEITNPDERQSPDPNRKWRIAPKMDDKNRWKLKEIKRQISGCLIQKRVVQQLPADRTGMPTDETIYRVLTSLDGEDDTVRLARNILSEKNTELATLKKKLDATVNREEKRAIQKRVTSMEQEVRLMQDFKRNAWIVHRIRKDSPTAKTIIERQTKYLEWREKHPLGIEMLVADTDTDGEKKERKPRAPQAPALLRPFDPQRHEFLIQYDVVSRIGLVGPSPEFKPGTQTQTGKLQAIKAAKTIRENFGIALLPEPEVVPFHSVSRRLKQLNGGMHVRVLRKGHLIHVPKGSSWEGEWRVLSVKNTEAFGLAVDLAERDGVELAKGNAPVKRLMADGMTILDTPLTGVASSPVPAKLA